MPRVTSPVPLKPPYPYQIDGLCAPCGAFTTLTRVYGPDFFRYRCAECLPKEPPVPPCPYMSRDECLNEREREVRTGFRPEIGRCPTHGGAA